MLLENSERFKSEFNSFKTRISAITNERVKTELNGLLTNLLREVRAIDEQHQSLFMQKGLPSMVSDSRNNIGDIRKLLLRRLEDWDRSQS